MTDIFVAPRQNKKQNNNNSSCQEEPHMSMLSSFCQKPKGVTFQTQKENEQVILFLRPYFLTNLTWIAISIFLIFLPPLTVTILPILGINFLSSNLISHFITVDTMFYYLIVSSYALISFLTWFYNIFIVTEDRIIDINYSDIVVHNVSETKLNHVEDVRYSQSGFIPTLFNYGDLFAQTAGTEENFEANSIPKPKDATDIITNLIGSD